MQFSAGLDGLGDEVACDIDLPNINRSGPRVQHVQGLITEHPSSTYLITIQITFITSANMSCQIVLESMVPTVLHGFSVRG